MVTEVCKCSEDLAYHGLRKEHPDIPDLQKDLESAQAKMSEEEKGKYKRLEGVPNVGSSYAR